MATYKYKARDTYGNLTKGMTEADTESDAVSFLRSKGMTVVSVAKMADPGTGLNVEIFPKKIKPDDLSFLCSQYGIILKSGIQVVECTRLIAKQTSNKKLRTILQDVEKDITAGRSLASSFEKRGGKAMPATFYEMVRAGEQSGNLVYAFETMKDYFSKSSKTSKKVKSALIYPSFVIVVGIIVMIVVMAYVMPTITDVFESFESELPGMTKLLMAMSKWFQKYSWLVFLILGVIIVGLFIYNKTEKGHYNIDKFKLHMPLLRKINVFNLSAQYANTLAMLLQSGMRMSNALDTLSRTIQNKVCEEAIQDVREQVEGGKSIGYAMGKHNLREKGMKIQDNRENKNVHRCFPPTLTDMVSIGQESSEIEDILKTTGDFYQDEADTKTKNLLAKLEPALLILVAIFAGFIVISIYLPMFEMYELF